MNEKDKMDGKNFVKAGQKVYAKIKEKAGEKIYEKLKGNGEGKIHPYEGADAYYSDSEPDTDGFFDRMKVSVNEEAAEPLTEEEAVTEIPAEEKEPAFSIRDVLDSIWKRIPQKKSKGDSFAVETEEQAEAYEEKAQEAFEYFEGISQKLDHLKKSVSDAVKPSENEALQELIKKGEALLKNDRLKKEDFDAELDKRMAELDKKFRELEALLCDKAAQTEDKLSTLGADIVVFDAEIKGKYDAIKTGIQAVEQTGAKSAVVLEETAGQVREIGERVSEIHHTTSGIDKLYDSVFELKNANINNKNALEDIRDKQEKLRKKCVMGFTVLGILTAVAVVLQIIALIM